MTENEAKTKWCPFIRVTVTPNDDCWQGNMLTNRGNIPAVNENLQCIGSECMAWEWQDCYDGYFAFIEDDGSILVANTNEKLKDAKERNLKEYQSEQGYCGLAK